MKSKSTITKRIAELRAIIDDPARDEFDVRLAYAVETALRWTITETVGWNVVRLTLEDAKLLREELARREG